MLNQSKQEWIQGSLYQVIRFRLLGYKPSALLRYKDLWILRTAGRPRHTGETRCSCSSRSRRLKPRSRAEVPGQSTHFPRKSHTMPPICWGAADTEGSGSGGALPPGRGVGRGAEGGGLVSERHNRERIAVRWERSESREGEKVV